MGELYDRHGPRYVTGPLPRQVASAWWTVIRLSPPNDIARRLPGADDVTHGSPTTAVTNTTGGAADAAA